jgi:phenylalanyl-tRNA synthetase beta subunit
LLGLAEIRLFEIGTVWKNGKEVIMLGIADASRVREFPLNIQEATPLGYDDLPTSKTERYQPFSRYPSITRDISLWVPKGTKPEDILEVIRKYAGDLLVRSELFDSFEKGAKMSFAFRLVFQSFDRTLTDEDANARMESVYEAVKKHGWEVR